ncbi:two-component system sensor histidine kinase NtrB [Desulfospira joergensenii]|uniref:two-component system sensor histidine kinase NtrB n=1 Tax=Desulfospira joergensenii TaxID=53329 RepID=UPI0009FEA10C|nr:ATP-binding protein [Desulfospira joergensenii]
MNWSLNIFLKNYDTEDKELFLRARFIILVTISVIIATLFTVAYAIWLQDINLTLSIQILTALVMVGALLILVKGYYTCAIHTIFISGFAGLWMVLFLDPVSPAVGKVDTIVLVTGLFSGMHIAFFKNRTPIAVYFSINALLFILFNFHLNTKAVLPPKEILEYFFDNAVAMVFVFVVVFKGFAVNRQVLAALKEELSERKKAEKALLDSEQKLSDHLETTPVGAIFWDLEIRAVEWNPSAERIFGYTKKEALGKHVSDLILPEEMKKPVAGIFKALLSGQGGERSINENITQSGKKILCDWYNSVLRNADGRVIGAASLVNDITEKVKIQEMMIQSEKMMSLGGLAAGMAHEVNNPLAGIIQTVQVASNRLGKESPANQKTAESLGIPLSAIHEYVEKRGVINQLDNIGKAARRAANVIDNMLNFSRKSTHVREKVRLPDLLDATIELAGHDHGLKGKYSLKNMEILREYSPGLEAVFCEKTKIQQVLFNLLTNASDSMNGKDYTDDSPRLILRLNRGEKNIHIQVEDNGIGMDPETCEHIFEPFFTTKEDKGTGLGLSISYYIMVREHGGQMEVASVPGQGTCFTIKLPIRSDMECRE